MSSSSVQTPPSPSQYSALPHCHTFHYHLPGFPSVWLIAVNLIIFISRFEFTTNCSLLFVKPITPEFCLFTLKSYLLHSLSKPSTSCYNFSSKLAINTVSSAYLILLIFLSTPDKINKDSAKRKRFLLHEECLRL